MGIDVFTLSKSKKYTDMVALGLSSATVDDVNKSITFTLASDGSQHTIHFDKPKDGVSVTGVSDKGDGTFTLLLSDGSETSTIQTIKGEKGDKGNTGAKGEPGADGYTPVKGTDYWTAEDIAEIQSYIDTQIGGVLNGSY